MFNAIFSRLNLKMNIQFSYCTLIIIMLRWLNSLVAICILNVAFKMVDFSVMFLIYLVKTV